MMYEYMTIDDNTSIAHSDMKADGSVKIYIEKPINGGFKNITCYLPSYEWKENNGFSNSEIEYFQKIIENNAHLIIEFSQKGGFDNASNY